MILSENRRGLCANMAAASCSSRLFLPHPHGGATEVTEPDQQRRREHEQRDGVEFAARERSELEGRRNERPPYDDDRGQRREGGGRDAREQCGDKDRGQE